MPQPISHSQANRHSRQLTKNIRRLRPTPKTRKPAAPQDENKYLLPNHPHELTPTPPRPIEQLNPLTLPTNSSLTRTRIDTLIRPRYWRSVLAPRPRPRWSAYDLLLWLHDARAPPKRRWRRARFSARRRSRLAGSRTVLARSCWWCG